MFQGSNYCGWGSSMWRWSWVADQAARSKPVSRILLWTLHRLLHLFLLCLSSCPDFFSDGWGCGNVVHINSFFPSLLWSWFFIIAIETLAKTGIIYLHHFLVHARLLTLSNFSVHITFYHPYPMFTHLVFAFSMGFDNHVSSVSASLSLTIHINYTLGIWGQCGLLVCRRG